MAWHCSKPRRTEQTAVHTPPWGIERSGNPVITKPAFPAKPDLSPGRVRPILRHTSSKRKRRRVHEMTVAALDDLGVYGPLNYAAADPYPATRRKLEEGPGFEVLTPTESFTLDGDDEYVVEVEPVPLDA